MDEVRATPQTGLRVVSLFSGAGGSCLGFRMAGFRVVWANEFIEAARETYRLNADPQTILDPRDVREITGASILEAIGSRPDVLEGSPPCASFSTSGKRAEHWGKVKVYSGGSQRTDDLFFEFVRIVSELRPRTFVAENVAGLVKGVSKGTFKRILAAMRELGYLVEARVVDAQWLGVPQVRSRLIFIGREPDVAQVAFPTPLPYRYTLRDVLPNVVRIRAGDSWRSAAAGPSGTVLAMGARIGDNSQISSGDMVEAMDLGDYAIAAEWDGLRPGQQSRRYFNLVRSDPAAPAPTITASGGRAGLAAATHPLQRRKFSPAELRRICSFPDDFVLTGSYEQQWERLGRAVPPLMMKAIAECLRDALLAS